MNKGRFFALYLFYIQPNLLSCFSRSWIFFLTAMAAKVSQRGAKGFYSFTSEEAGHKDERIKNKDKKKKKLLLVISNVERNLSPMFVSPQTFKFFILNLQKPDIF
jgi:hypothetical protein